MVVTNQETGQKGSNEVNDGNAILCQITHMTKSIWWTVDPIFENCSYQINKKQIEKRNKVDNKVDFFYQRLKIFNFVKYFQVKY